MSSAGSAAVTTVLCDVNGTLTDPAAIGEVWGHPELGVRVLDAAIATGMVDALLGAGDRPFADHLRAALSVLAAETGLGVDEIERAAHVAASLPARPGAADALGSLRATGLRLVALTNSGASAGRATLEGCGLIDCFDAVLGVDAIGTFKPDPAVYSYALAELDTEASQVVMLATHPWDLAGAAFGGMRTAWVRWTAGRAWPAVFPEPDVAGDSLTDVAEAISALA